jgi:hypothetical protein
MLVASIFSENRKNDISSIIEDCKTAFNCRCIEGEDNYSVGSTYFCLSNGIASCGIEALALQIFTNHVQQRGLSYDPDKSGAEWWTQNLDCRDDIALHWDRDYGLEERSLKCVYPTIATVTYLTDCGGPTIVFEKKGDSTSNSDICSHIPSCYISSPKVGKHISFDGSLLHFAPSDLLYHESTGSSDNESEDSASTSASELSPRRITFLVNIWIDHVPEDCVQFKPTSTMKFSYPTNNEGFTFSNLSGNQSPYRIYSLMPTSQKLKWRFTHGEMRYELAMTSFSNELVDEVIATAKSSVVELQLDKESSNGMCLVEIDRVDEEEEVEDDDGDDDKVAIGDNVIVSAVGEGFKKQRRH